MKDIKYTKAGAPKLPIKPDKPKLPEPPAKTISKFNRINIDHPFTLTQFLLKIPANINHDDVIIDCDYDYDSAELKIGYNEELPNEKYDAQYKKYQSNLKIYEVKLEKYKDDYNLYLEQKKAWEEWKDLHEAAEIDKKIAELQKLREKKVLVIDDKAK